MLGYDIEGERIPAVYELSYKKGSPPCLELRLHEEFVAAKKDIIPIEGFLKGIQKEHNLGAFSPLKEESFGFDRALKKKGRDSRGFIIYEIEIPRVRRQLDEPCSHCKGACWNKDFGRQCTWCHGTGHKILYDWPSIDAISASLQVLGMLTGTFEERTSANDCQLLTFQLVCGKELGGYSIKGYYGIDFCRWLASLPKPYQFNNVLKEMQYVYFHIFGKDSPLGFDFHAYVDKDTWLIITVPGNASGICPSNYSWKAGKGREYGCCNMDTSAQQVMILVALGILSDMARGWMKGNL
jgi:hypothetical protein